MITQEELVKIARLAKLSLDGENAAALAADMADIISIASSIDDADLSALDCSGSREEAALRTDTVMPPLSRELILKNAAECRDGYFTGPSGAGNTE